MNERWDAMLVHCYMFRYTGEPTPGWLRNHLQDKAAALIYKSGAVKNLYLAGGYLWGENKPSLAELMADELVQNDVSASRIIVDPEIKDTFAEVDLFLDESTRSSWSSLASLANKGHLRRVGLIYQDRSMPVNLVCAEDTLTRAGVNIQYPSLVTETIFTARELVVTELYQLGLERQLRSLADYDFIEKIKSYFDS